MILYESKMAKVEWIENDRVVKKAFLGFIFGEDVRKAFIAGTEALEKYQGKKWLSDNSLLKPYHPDDVQWINEVFFPRALAAGWKYWAVIEPENFLGKRSMRHFLDFYQEKGITMKIFPAVDEGMAWLRSV